MIPAGAPLAPSAPARRPRVLVADDSVVVRGLIGRWLAESGIDVVASVSNGRAAVEALDRVDPDIVLLDLDMPELDGLGALPRLLAKRPALTVVVVSTLTKRNAEISLKCLRLGAIDYLPKPETNREVTTSTSFRQELVAKVEALARPLRRTAGDGTFPRPVAFSSPLRLLPVVPRCLLIGASTGGPKAIGQVLAETGEALRAVPILIVQHMPPIFTAVFAEHLSAQLGLPAREAQHGEALLAGRIYVAPGGRHMGVANRGDIAAIRLDDSAPVNFCRPAVDVLFRDAAAVFGSSALALVLTGMGSDGLQGCRALSQAGAGVIVQDEVTSTVWGMPGHVARAGLAREVLPLDDIGTAVARLVGGGR
ncbi:MAG TPA: chemotaxis response regulator protein-glutamate methylesterase [Beijerinckiaceae bacterium]|jgi:two-component system chemotaxis response regulator CheB|nr:chemotaxis response regulator protein-glutamate methylesterase [Microvirga sp.]HZB38135.1 chemotaxis response regulator protein-glutamate methylesterase [Beijerinckiaceae bacterium]